MTQRCTECCQFYTTDHFFHVVPGNDILLCCVCIQRNREYCHYSPRLTTSKEEENKYLKHAKKCEYLIDKPIIAVHKVTVYRPYHV